jgi:hypothetical protein
MSDAVERAREHFEQGRVREALMALEPALWEATARSDWHEIETIEVFLTGVLPWAGAKERRRCKYLLHAARTSLEARPAGTAAPASEPASAVTVDELLVRVVRLEEKVEALRRSGAPAEARHAVRPATAAVVAEPEPPPRAPSPRF